MFSNVKKKNNNASFAVTVTEKSNYSFFHFYCLIDESRFSDICTIMELKQLNWLCKHVKKSEAANLVFQWIFVLNSVKRKFLHVSIVNAAFLAARILEIFTRVVFIFLKN